MGVWLVEGFGRTGWVRQSLSLGVAMHCGEGSRIATMAFVKELSSPPRALGADFGGPPTS